MTMNKTLLLQAIAMLGLVLSAVPSVDAEEKADAALAGWFAGNYQNLGIALLVLCITYLGYNFPKWRAAAEEQKAWVAAGSPTCTVNDVGEIAEDKYWNNKTLRGKLIIPEGVTHIRYYAFWGCSNITSVHIPDTVTSIGWGAFDDCDSLTSASIKRGTKYDDGSGRYWPSFPSKCRLDER